MKYMMHGQPMECSLGGFRLPQRQRHQKERPHREVAQITRNRKDHSEKWHVEQAQWGHHGKQYKYMTDSQKWQKKRAKAELTHTRLKGPTEVHMILAVVSTGFARSFDDHPPKLTFTSCCVRAVIHDCHKQCLEQRQKVERLPSGTDTAAR